MSAPDPTQRPDPLTLEPTGATRIARYLGFLLAAMALIVLYLGGLALFQRSTYWLGVALPFVAESAVIFGARVLLGRGRVTEAALLFVWGSLAAIIPFVVLFPAAYPASVVAVAQVEAIGLAYLRGRALATTLVGLTVAAAAVTGIGNALAGTGSLIEKASITVIVLLSFGLLSLILALNQARLTRAVVEAQRARDSLEEKVEERTAELREANVAAEKATRAKSEFLANMSHELRTPLNAVLGFSEILMEQAGSALTDPHRRYLGNIRQAGEHLLGLINDVLDLSKVEAGRIDLRPETFRLPALIEPVLAATRAAAEERGVAFDAGEVTPFAVRIDAGRMRQVLYNLLSNAVKFTPPGGRVTLRVRQEGASLAIEVTDTGIGIPRDRQERMFGAFERLHEGRSDATGTGLGLALTKRLVELHGGTISFESEADRGTTFRVFIPDVVVEPPAGARVLIVEDVPTDADLIAATAAEFGLASEVVTSAAAAIDAIRRDPPRGVVLDLRLPDERGEQVLKWAKDDPSARGIPVIVVTVEDDEGRSRPLGADDHITKPIDRQRLGAWLERLRLEDPTGARAPR